MPTEPRSPWPQRTTFWTGALLLAAGLLDLLAASRFSVAVTEQFVVPLSGPVVGMAASVLQAAALAVAAVGVAGEIGLVGGLRWGRAALILTGALGIGLEALALPTWETPPSPVLVLVPLAQLVALVAALLGGIAVVRARVVSGPARWILLATTVLMVVLQVVGSTPLALALLLTWPSEYLVPIVTLLTGVAFLLWGRIEAVKHRARVIHDAW